MEKIPMEPAELEKGFGEHIMSGGSARLDDEEKQMQELLREEYKKQGRNWVSEAKAWREKNPRTTLGDAIRALYAELEE
ncbi:MAG: hypothetical protein PHE24_06835 [Patescibacteria group bacterium]|nr:hypothetical protein [Patescibacteria group bacterium]